MDNMSEMRKLLDTLEQEHDLMTSKEFAEGIEKLIAGMYAECSAILEEASSEEARIECAEILKDIQKLEKTFQEFMKNTDYQKSKKVLH